MGGGQQGLNGSSGSSGGSGGDSLGGGGDGADGGGGREEEGKRRRPGWGVEEGVGGGRPNYVSRGGHSFLRSSRVEKKIRRSG